jgi:signal transduction histidine kinase
MTPQSPPPINLLLVDDLRENLVALEALLRGPGRRVLTATSGDDALSLLLEHDFALAILDVQMPGMDGFELAELMRGTERTRHIPIVFVTAAGRELNYAFRGYESGAVDFLYKPLDPHAVRGKVDVFVELQRQRQAMLVLQSELECAVRMRDDFMSLVSHELRNPLNTLYLQSQLRQRLVARGEAPGFDAFRDMVARDGHQIRSMVRLLDDIMDVGRVRTGQLSMSLRPVDLAAIARRAVGSMEEQARSLGVPLTVEGAQELPISGDEFRLEQVLLNLMTNALRYGLGRPVGVVLDETAGHACVTVTDQGPGIAADEQQRIFEQFERGSNRQNAPGLGLGLFISREIVHAHNGSLDLRSEVGQGASFTVRLPLARQTTP